MTLLREQEMRRRLVAEGMTWLKTPYHHHGRVKGVGVDCAQILIAVAAEVGVVEAFDPGNYARDWHLHRNEELYAQWLDRCGRRIERRQVQPGDVALLQFGRTYSHGGIVSAVDGGEIELIHSYVGLGVTTTRLSEAPLDGRPVLFWSLF